jgi:hypothetical protein
MTLSHPITGRSTTMFHNRTLRIVILAVGILAFSASAAQARPLGLGYTGDSQSQSTSKAANGFHFINPTALHSSQGSSRANLAGTQVMSPAVDPANAQQVPVVVTQAQPVAVSDSGFNWTAAILGAGIASVVLLLAGATASRNRPRGVAQL